MISLFASAAPARPLLAGLLCAAACSSVGPAEGRTIRRPAVLAFYGDVTEVQVPTTAQVGVPFTVDATSFGGGCVAQGETEVTVTGLLAEVRPYRYELVEASGVCTSELRIDHNTARVQFEVSGRARVQIIGLTRPGEQPYVAERAVVVGR